MGISSILSGAIGGAAGAASVMIVIKAVDEFSGTMSKASSEVSSLGSLAGGAAVAGIAAVSAAMITGGVAAVNYAKDVEPIRNSFKKLATDSDNFLKSLNKSTEGTVSDFELMANANKALLLGIEQNNLSDLFKNAAIVGQAAGRTTTEAIQDITLGIGRQSKLILDNLGIIVKAEEAYDNYAAAHNKLTKDLTEEEKRTAFTEAAMAALEQRAKSLGGTLSNTTSKSIEQLKASLANMGLKIGDMLLPGLNKIVDYVNDSLLPVFETKVMPFLENTLIPLFKDGFESIIPALQYVKESLTGLEPVFKFVGAAFLVLLRLMLNGWAMTMNAIGLFINVLKIVLTPITMMGRVFYDVIVNMGERMQAFKDLLSSIWNLLKTIWTNTWKAIANSFIFIWDTIIKGLQDGINIAINALNFLIKKINKIPGVNIPTIPKLTLESLKIARFEYEDLGAAMKKVQDASKATAGNIPGIITDELTNAVDAAKNIPDFVKNTTDIAKDTASFLSTELSPKRNEETPLTSGNGTTNNVEVITNVSIAEASDAKQISEEIARAVEKKVVASMGL